MAVLHILDVLLILKLKDSWNRGLFRARHKVHDELVEGAAEAIQHGHCNKLSSKIN